MSKEYAALLARTKQRAKIAGEEEEAADLALLRAVDGFRNTPSVEAEQQVVRAMAQSASKQHVRNLWQKAVAEMERED